MIGYPVLTYMERLTVAVETATCVPEAASALYRVLREERKVMVIGNGGSAAIASHVANDIIRAGVAAMTFTDPAILTCLANDLGYAHAIVEQVKLHAKVGDILLAISSSGESANIQLPVRAVRGRCRSVTFTGFMRDNTLSSLGDINVYVDAKEYGVVELAHQIILHEITDGMMGLRRKADAA
jgi:D-sedoheptulose 7-phosphate isomerase